MELSRLYTILILLVTSFDLLGQDKLAQLVQKSKPSVFSIKTYDKKWNALSYGTGFFVDSTTGVSNYHVFRGAAIAIIKTIDGKKYRVKDILLRSESSDLIEFSISDSTPHKFPYLKMNKEEPKEGEAILVIGNPEMLEYTVSNGIVSSIRNNEGFDKTIQITSPISSGSSGSPVINMKGEVIAVVSSTLSTGQNLNFATCISNLGHAVYWLRSPNEDLSYLPTEGLSLDDKKEESNVVVDKTFKRFEWGTSIINVLETEKLELVRKASTDASGYSITRAPLDHYLLKYKGVLFGSKILIEYLFKNDSLISIEFTPYRDKLHPLTNLLPLTDKFVEATETEDASEAVSGFALIESKLKQMLHCNFEGGSIFRRSRDDEPINLSALPTNKTLLENISASILKFDDFSIKCTDHVTPNHTFYTLNFIKHPEWESHPPMYSWHLLLSK